MNKKTALATGAVLFSLACFYYAVLRYIRLDFYYDELYTMIHYVFVPLRETVTVYLDANNHFFSNLINNIALKAMSEESVTTLMDHPWKIRLVQLPYSFISLGLIYLLTLKAAGRRAAVLSVVILATTIPFVNYAVQVRGYEMNVMLCCLVIYLLLRYENSLRTPDGLLLSLGVAGFLYSMPSNLYTLAGFYLYYSIDIILHFSSMNAKKNLSPKKRGKADPERSADAEEYQSVEKLRLKRSAGVLAFVTGGILLSALAYAPLALGMLADKQLKSEGLFYNYNLVYILPNVLLAYVSWRWLIVAAALAGCAVCLYDRERRVSSEARMVVLSVICLFIPFIISYVRGDRPYDRHFIGTLPFFCMIMAIGTDMLVQKIERERWTTIVEGALILYCLGTFFYGIHQVDRILKDDIYNGEKRVSMLASYFQYKYAPKHLMEELNEFVGNAPRTSLALVIAYGDALAMPQYLKKHGYNLIERDFFLNNITVSDNWLLISARPYRLEREITERFPDYTIERYNKNLQFHNIFILRRKQ